MQKGCQKTYYESYYFTQSFPQLTSANTDFTNIFKPVTQKITTLYECKSAIQYTPD